MVEVRGEFKLFGKNISVSDEGKGGWKHEMKDHISTNETTISQDSEHEMKPTTNFVTGDQEIEDREVVKKPDKILACPRCSSMSTKFCYFNNYNVNQPRYFCKNCQRYWTAGGTIRNVPVGSGRRKTKHVLNHYRAITLSHFNPNLTLLAFNDNHLNGSTLVNHHYYYPLPVPRSYSGVISSPSSSGSRTNSSLGKHSRDWEILTQDVDQFGKNGTFDPTEEAIIIQAMGSKNEKHGGKIRRLFDGFEGETTHETDLRCVLLINPAAKSRSMNFQERI